MTSDRWEVPADHIDQRIDVEPLRVTTLYVERINIQGEQYIATYNNVRKYFVEYGVLFIEKIDVQCVINSDRWIDVTAYTHNEIG